jgi:hypothetical protein
MKAGKTSAAEAADMIGVSGVTCLSEAVDPLRGDHIFDGWRQVSAEKTAANFPV